MKSEIVISAQGGKLVWAISIVMAEPGLGADAPPGLGAEAGLGLVPLEELV